MFWSVFGLLQDMLAFFKTILDMLKVLSIEQEDNDNIIIFLNLARLTGHLQCHEIAIPKSILHRDLSSNKVLFFYFKIHYLIFIPQKLIKTKNRSKK